MHKPRTRVAIEFFKTEFDTELVEYLLPGIVHKCFSGDNTYYIMLLGELISPNYISNNEYFREVEKCDMISDFVGSYMCRCKGNHIIRNLLKSYKVIDAQIDSGNTIYLEWEKV